MSTKLGTCATQDTPDLPYVQSVQPGTNVTVDDTDPRNPIVSSTGGGGGGTVDSVVAGSGISVDDTDPANPIVSATEGGGTVTTVSVVTDNGVSGSVANPTTTPAITLTLGAITPSSVAASGTVGGSNLSGTNTGDQTITLTGDVTGTGTGSFATTLANTAVTPGTYGDSQDVAVVTVDSKGRITGISTAAIIGGTGLSASILADSPLNYWKCNETTGTTITDYGSGAKNLTLQGTNTLNYTQIVNGYGALYSPTASVYSSQNGAKSSGLSFTPPITNFTCEAIICCAQPSSITNNTLIFSAAADSSSGSSNNLQFSMRLNGIIFEMVWEYGSDTVLTLSGPPLSNDRHHLAVVNDSTALTVSFYLDGALTVIAPYILADIPTGGANCNYCVSCGSAYSGASLSQSAIVSNVAFWNSKLTGTQLKSHAIASGYFY